MTDISPDDYNSLVDQRDALLAERQQLKKAARRVVAVDAAHGLPDENTSFDAYNEWVAALYALKEAVGQ